MQVPAASSEHVSDSESTPDNGVIRDSLAAPEVFSLLFARHGSSIYRYLVRQTSMTAAEDLLSETFLVAFRTRANFDQTIRDARPWLYGIASNTARHHFRSEARHFRIRRRAANRALDLDDQIDDVDRRIDSQAHRRRLQLALEVLDNKHREVILLAASGLSYQEIAVALDIPIGTVRSRLSRARRQLRDLLGASGQYGEEVRGALPDEMRGHSHG